MTIRQAGRLSFHHCGVRSLGDDFEECVAYQFDFEALGTFSAQWNRSFGQWSAANERQVGRWAVVGEALRCETQAGLGDADGCVPYAPAGRVFELPVASVLAGTSAADGTTPAWEFQVRGAPVPEVVLPSLLQGSSAQAGLQEAARNGSNVRFVEVDGELHEVSADILKHYPESDWQRLMRCRVRFGLC
eukprot:CAMPEP_0171068168 /NCGR_PEP_ID=MMETSP0766_2-20121228/8411_1 /TAXON_ID=439317 /ORGANISM="Gambierdiscus australes, Strain CAWD 149" /LENGTH=188 /DNA_ID=CAMNT_0011524455 /DNA_START=167 /DNA_END=733 /DNA_ORIENTATION=-